MNTAIQTYGSTQEITAMASRFKTALRGGEKLNNNELYALAQVAQLTKLNPFNGEIWCIPGKGTMIGIAGARRLWQEQSKSGGGFSFVEIAPCSPEEAGATEPDVVAAFKATAHDSKATAQYQKLFLETVNSLRAAGSTDPVKEAREIVGKKPEWIGYGYSTKGETSRMNKTQLARKRAEADALKKCVVIPFGAEIAEQEAHAEYVEAVISEYDPTPQSATASDKEQERPRTSAPQGNDNDKPHNGHPRPYSPEHLKDKILDIADKMSATPLKGNEAQIIAMNMAECFAGNEDKRKELLRYLTGKTSTKDLDAGWQHALKKWLNPQHDPATNKWFADPLAVQEANAAYEAAMLANGQLQLPAAEA